GLFGVNLNHGVEREDDRLAVPRRRRRILADFEDPAAGVLDEVPAAIAAAKKLVQTLLDSTLSVSVDVAQANHLRGNAPLGQKPRTLTADSPDVGGKVEAADPRGFFVRDATLAPQKPPIGMRGKMLEESIGVQPEGFPQFAGDAPCVADLLRNDIDAANAY